MEGLSAERLLAGLQERKSASITLMEVCGTHTMSSARAGLPALLPEGIRLLSGPGCPVCVSPVRFIDHAQALAVHSGVTVATFGDLMCVPGSSLQSLATCRARGGDVRVVYSPLDALRIARRAPDRQVVFLSVGFETTTPVVAASVLRAEAEGLANFSILCANRTVIEAMELLATSGEPGLHGFLCPGHVSMVIGTRPYRTVNAPCAIAGFEPVEMLRGIDALVRQIERGEVRVDNCYGGAVRPEGNRKAREAMETVFEKCDGEWRGIGTIPGSGQRFRAGYRKYDAARRFSVSLPEPAEPRGCRCGDVLRGVLDPGDCGLFGNACTPDTPTGPCMVSGEGSCAARYHFGRGGET